MAIKEATMQAKDTVSTKLASAFVTIEGQRYLLFQAKSFEAKIKKNKKTVDILGKTASGNKASGWTGTFDLTIYHNTELFNDLFEKYKNTGEDIYFDLQVTNEDPSSAAGRNTKIYKDVLIYKKDYTLTKTDKAFITELNDAKRKYLK